MRVTVLHMDEYQMGSVLQMLVTLREGDRSTTHLTCRQRMVVDLVRRGFIDKEIANELCITTSAAKSQIRNILKACGVTTRHRL